MPTNNEFPISFDDCMVRALLEGRKTQSRRPLNPQPAFLNGGLEFWGEHNIKGLPQNIWITKTPSGKIGVTKPPYYESPYGMAGSHLWVREAWGYGPSKPFLRDRTIHYRADNINAPVEKWELPRSMNKRTSRIALRVTDVRVQRLHDITDEECYAEGIDSQEMYEHGLSPREEFIRLWNSIYGGFENRNFAANPWVFVLNFLPYRILGSILAE